MPSPFYNKSKNFLLRMLTGESNVHDIGTGFNALGEDVDALLTSRLLTTSIKAGSFALKSGELVLATGAGGGTVTLPAATANAIVGVFCGSATTTVKLTASGGAVVFGDFVSALGTITLTTDQHVILVAEGTNWLIIAGEPKREAVYSAQTERALATEFEPSATRPTQVVLDVIAAAGEGEIEITVGGVKIGEIGLAGAKRTTTSFIVPAGQKWVCTKSGANALLVKSTYLTL